MRIKKFKLFENKSEIEITPLEEIKEYFTDLIDMGFDFHEVTLQNTNKKIRYINPDTNTESSVKRDGYDWIIRDFRLQFDGPSKKIDTMEFTKEVNNFTMEAITSISTIGMDLHSVIVKVRPDFSEIYVTFLEDIRGLGIDNKDETISIFYDKFMSVLSNIVRQKVKYGMKDLEVNISGKNIVIDCKNLSSNQILTLKRQLSDYCSIRRRNATYNLNSYYYSFDVGGKGTVIVISNIQKVIINQE
jgi:hypothetical protein